VLLLPPTSTIDSLKEEIATALNDTSPPRTVKPDDISVYRSTDGHWKRLGEAEKGGKRAREATLEELDIRGVGSGSTVDGDGETLAYTVKNGMSSEETVDIEPYPRDD
jgi:hypothetical protein